MRAFASRFVARFRKETSKQHLYAKVKYEIFEPWETDNFAGDLFLFARRRFDGAGSNGNGAAMRSAAVALSAEKTWTR